jgi:hypothetical protein
VPADSPPGAAADAGRRLAGLHRLLQSVIRGAGLTQKEVDARIGRRPGYLSHVFQGRVDLKLLDVLKALEVLKVEPGAFFRTALAGRSGERPAVEDLLRLAAGLHGAWLLSPPARGARVAEAGAGEDPEVLEQVRRAVRALLAEVGGAPGAPRGGHSAAEGHAEPEQESESGSPKQPQPETRK